jgi:PleD family two-component response regulator
LNTPERHPTILIVEDDRNLAEMLDSYFEMQGYQVMATSWGEHAVQLADEALPDLVLLDILLPDMDGFEVCQRLRASHKTRTIPIIFLTERNQRRERLLGLKMGVVDYITKPFDLQELRLRVRNVLNRVANPVEANPVTGLPDEAATDIQLQAYLDNPYSGKGLLVVTLRGLNSFRELYGFIASDEVLRVVSLMVRNAVGEVAGHDAYCGHLFGHTFVTIAPNHTLDALTDRVIERAAYALEYFYPGDNRGPNAYTDDRLRLLIGQVTDGDGFFPTLDALKQQAIASQLQVPPVVDDPVIRLLASNQ